VLAGGGRSYQTSGDDDARTYAIGVDDLLWHPANGDAHTLVAGDDGLTVLVVAEGSRTNITWLPRTGQFWLGPVWSPADTPHPFAADAALGPLALPPPTAERPPTIRNLSELPLHEGRSGRLACATRDLRDMGSDKLVLAQDAMPPDTHNTDLHFHSAREEAWYVRSGSGTARLGDDAHPLRPGSFWLCRENTRIGHRIEVGPDGMDLVTMGDLIPGDVCVYPEKRTFKPARGLEVPY
jgi:mannose-6-phosphate isomerase-like protein (cupin superfamily)